MKQVLFLLFALKALSATAQELPLYGKDPIPGEIKGENKERSETNKDGVLIIHQIRYPTLTVFLPPKAKANGAAVVICPGGGYWVVAAKHEGYDVAKKFNEMVVAAFVLKYRIPDSAVSTDPMITPLQDAQQAILTVRKRAKEWNIDTARIGVLGFSAGGHLASTVGTHFDQSFAPNPGNISVRPNFMVLVYAVISADTTINHRGSFQKLLGNKATDEKRRWLSSELHVNASTPPTILIQSSDDKGVPPGNSIVFYEALVKNNVPAEMHIYKGGGHGYGMNNPTTKDQWMERVRNFLQSLKII